MAVDLGTIGNIIPSKAAITSTAGSLFFWITILIIIFILLIGGGIGVFLLLRYWKFNKKIFIFDDRNGHLEYIGKDRAKELKYNIYGDTVFVLRKRKRYLPRGTIKSGRNLYCYAIREDGEWINISFGSVNQALKEAAVKFIHPDMRAFKSGMSKIMKDSYQKQSFIKEYLPIILPIVFFLIVAVALYFIVDRIVASENNLLEMTKAAQAVMEKAGEVLSATNNICQTSGVKA